MLEEMIERDQLNKGNKYQQLITETKKSPINYQNK